MSISHALSNALTGLSAASRMAEVVSSNLSNVLTDGYGRRQVNLSAQSVGGRGAGVSVDGIARVVDRGVLAERRSAEAAQSRTTLLAETYGRLEMLIGTPGEAGSLEGRLAALEAALAASAIDPSSDIRLGDVVNRLKGVASTLNADQDGIMALRQEADAAIARQVDTLNTALKQVKTLNDDILNARLSGADATALMDKRQTVIDTIAGIVPVKEIDRGKDQVALMTPSGEVLLDGSARTYGFAQTGTIMPHMTYGAGMLSGITHGGTPLPGTTAVGKLGGGSLEAAFEMRDTTLVKAQTDLDAIARDLVERFQDPAVDPTLSAAVAGLLTDAGTAFDPLNASGLAGRIAVNAAVDPTEGGLLSRLRDGVAATTAGPVGNAAQIEAWLDALKAPRALASGGMATTAAGHATRFTSGISAGRVTADEEQAFDSARWSTLREIELGGGVDTDQELQMLLRVEQAYAANAKVVQTIDSMVRTLMEI